MTHLNPKKGLLSLRPTPLLIIGSLSLIILACSDRARAKMNLVFKAPPEGSHAVVKIGDQEFSDAELTGKSKKRRYELEMALYQFKLERLNHLLVEKLVGPEAKAAGMPLNEFIQKKIVSQKIKISDKEFKQFLVARNFPESQLNAELTTRIKNHMEEAKKEEELNEHVAKLTHKTRVEAYFSEPSIHLDIPSADSPSSGPDDAAVTIMVFSDFQCPHCSAGAERLNQVKKKYGNKIRVVFKNYPLPMHNHAQAAAEAGLCVNAQNSDRFWKFHDILFKNQDKLDSENLARFAKEVGVDIKQYTECMESKKFANVVAKDMTDAEENEINATPSFLINGQPLGNGAPSVEAFTALIDKKLSQK